MSPRDLDVHPLNRYTHCEIHPATIMSVIPPKVLNQIATKYSVTPEQLVEAAQACPDLAPELEAAAARALAAEQKSAKLLKERMN